MVNANQIQRPKKYPVSRCCRQPALADFYAFDDAPDSDKFLSRELELLFDAGFCHAPLPAVFGGAGMGTEPGSQWPMLEILKELGRANLNLARVYEGRVNAIILVFAFGTAGQKEQAARACFHRKLFALWNTDGARPVKLLPETAEIWKLQGEKVFASAVEHAPCVLFTAESPGGEYECVWWTRRMRQSE